MLDFLRLEDNGVPIYVQIRDKMLRAIGAGRLRPGDQMPTMREVAVALKVDLNTVRHAYRELERTGAIVIVPARGTFVAAQHAPLAREAQERRAEELALQAVAAATVAGVDPRDVAGRIVRIADSKGGGE